MGNLNHTEPVPILPKWVRAKHYAKMTGITESAIAQKRQHGVWREGVEWKRAPDGNVMINWQAIDQWVES